MKTIFINDIPIYFKNLDNTSLIIENYDTFIDGSSGIIPLKLFSRVLIYDANFQTITDLLKKMTKTCLQKESENVLMEICLNIL